MQSLLLLSTSPYSPNNLLRSRYRYLPTYLLATGGPHTHPPMQAHVTRHSHLRTASSYRASGTKIFPSKEEIKIYVLQKMELCDGAMERSQMASLMQPLITATPTLRQWDGNNHPGYVATGLNPCIFLSMQFWSINVSKIISFIIRKMKVAFCDHIHQSTTTTEIEKLQTAVIWYEPN